MIGWTAVMVSLQQWLSETPAQKSTASTPAYFSVGMAVLALGVVSLLLLLYVRVMKLMLIKFKAYMPLFLPPQAPRAGAGSGTEAPPAAPL